MWLAAAELVNCMTYIQWRYYFAVDLLLTEDGEETLTATKDPLKKTLSKVTYQLHVHACSFTKLSLCSFFRFC